MSAGKIIPYDSTLVAQSVNYHGHNLLKHLVSENAAQIHTIKLQDIDFKVNQSRTAEIRNLGSRAQNYIKFIASKSDCLLVSQPKCTEAPTHEDNTYKDRYNHQLPLEYFLKVEKKLRISSFLEGVKQGDLLLAVVHNQSENGTLLEFIAFDGGKHRYLNDATSAEVRILLRAEDTVVSAADVDKHGRWLKGTRLRVEVLSAFYNGGFETILVGTKGVTLSDKLKNKVYLGKVNLSDIPPILSVTPDPSLKHLFQCIEKMESFKNPQCIKDMSRQMNMDLRSYPSLMNTLRGEYPQCDMAASLRKAQMCKWAHKSVADGVTHFKKKRHEEAFQCLNKALQIDPENVEAFVAKGALLANMGRYEKAVEDFEKSLKYNPTHVNARKYMCETLVELGKQLEENDKPKEAEKCYKKCLDVNKDHEGAKEALKAVAKKLGTDISLIKLLINEESPKNKEEDFLSDLLEMEIELKTRRRNEESASEFKKVNTIKDVSESPEEVDAVVNERTCEVKERVPSLSPLSQKMAMQQNLWAPPPDLNPTLSFISQPPPSVVNPIIPNFSMFNNPPPQPLQPPSQWPYHNPIQHSVQYDQSSVPGYTEDPQYKARVDQFLRQLESRSLLTDKKREKSKERSRSKKRESKKRKKRTRASSHSCSDSSRSRSKSRSNSSSSSSSSTSSSSIDENTSKRKRKKKSSKKVKKNKKEKEKISKEKEKHVKEKLKISKEKEKKIKEKEENLKEKEKPTKEKGKITKVKEKNTKEKEKNAKEKEKSTKEKEKNTKEKEKNTKEKEKNTKEKEENTKENEGNSKEAISDGPDNVFPDFEDLEKKLQAYYKKMEAMQEVAESPPVPADKKPPTTKKERDSKKKVASKEDNTEEAILSTKILPQSQHKLANKLSLNVHPAFMEGDSDGEQGKPNVVKSGNSTTALAEIVSSEKSFKKIVEKIANSQKQITSSSSSNSSSRSSSFSSRSRSRSHSKSRHRRRSRSRGSYHRRSRSRDSRRRRSRSKGSYRCRSRSGGSYYHRDSRRRYKSRSRSRSGSRSRSRSRPRYGYYENKPVYNYKNRGRFRGSSFRPKPSSYDSKQSRVSKPLGIGEEAKQKIHKHLALKKNDLPTENKAVKVEKGKTDVKDVGKEKQVENGTEKKDLTTIVPEPAARFGKWAKEVDTDHKEEIENSGSADTKINAPGVSLDQFENFLKIAKEKKLEMMKERNKAFLKPTIE